MDRLDLMRTFVAALEARSFSAAAARLDTDPKLVSKHIAALERSLSVQLFHRTTRSISPTDEGRRLYDGATDLLGKHDEVIASLRGEQRNLSGRLRISAPVAWGEVVLRPLVRKFAETHAKLNFDVRLSDRFVDLAEEGIDLALRIGGPEASALTARRLGGIGLVLVASPALIDIIGTPTKIEDLQTFPTVGDANLRTGQTWLLQGPEGQQVRLPISPRFTVNSARVAADLTVDGAGLALLPEFSVLEAIEDGRLVRVLRGWSGPMLPLRAVFLEPRWMPQRVRSFVDFLVAEVSKR